MFTLQCLIGKSCFLIMIFSVNVKSILVHFETSSNASQFIYLENLIGSIHKHAPQHLYIFVRDMGLSRGQHRLLKQYQNVRVISPIYKILERTQFINVDEELVIIHGKYIEQQNNEKLVYVDFIRKRYQLAIVIPFIRSQLSNVIFQLNLAKIYNPCRNPSNSVDLIFYHNEGEHSSLQIDIRKIEYFHKCYRNIRYLAIKLTGDENEYPLGSFLMWQKLVLDDEDNNHVCLRNYGYTHLFLMEADTRPIREYWLDAIIDQITDGQNDKVYLSTDWWISGSVYRGSQEIGQRFLHINGNALYHLSSNFLSYVELFSQFYLTQDNVKFGYDLMMFSFLLHNPELGKMILHKFRFSEFIQNCWHTGCEGSEPLNNTEFILNNPSTYLVHGSCMKEEELFIQSSGNSTPIFSLLCVPIFFFILCWYYRTRRLSRLKRDIILSKFWKQSRKI